MSKPHFTISFFVKRFPGKKRALRALALRTKPKGTLSNRLIAFHKAALTSFGVITHFSVEL
jgi:hypothetical protein